MTTSGSARRPKRVRAVLGLWLSGALSTRQVVRIAMRISRFERWGARPISQARFRVLNHGAEQSALLHGEIGPLRQAAARVPALEAERAAAASLAARLQAALYEAASERAAAAEASGRVQARNLSLGAQLDQAMQTVAHLRRIEVAYTTLIDQAEADRLRIGGLERSVAQLEAGGVALRAEQQTLQTANQQLLATQAQILAHNDALQAANAAAAAAARVSHNGVQALMNEIQRMLFEAQGNTAPSEAATTLVLADQPVADTLATLVNLSDAAHGARPFQNVLPMLAPTRPFPLPWPGHLPPLRIVDVGSQELATEADMHAPLRPVAPVEIIGFDPFAEPAPGGGSADVTRSDGSVMRTFPVLLADGAEVVLHVNRYDATSSLLPSNHALTRQFGLLDLAVETVETRTLPSRRLDDVLPTEGEAARVDLLKIDVQGVAHLLLENAPKVLRNTLVCHVEIEFAPVYLGEKLFGDVDVLLRQAGFCFVDFYSLGRQRYARFDTSAARAFHRGRTLWGDCIYVRDLDSEDGLSDDDLLRASAIVHACYNKQDLAADLLGRHDGRTGGDLLSRYLDGHKPDGHKPDGHKP